MLESNDAFPSIMGVALRLRGSGLAPFELVLHSWDKKKFHVVKGGEVEVQLTEGWAEVSVAFRGLEWQLWAGLEFRNRGSGTALLALDALSLKLPASQQMLESQVRALWLRTSWHTKSGSMTRDKKVGVDDRVTGQSGVSVTLAAKWTIVTEMDVRVRSRQSSPR